ncbi:hypothetical protein [Pseudocnuella soli]|nr:hypothetical protein [Pseudocnuella soli]
MEKVGAAMRRLHIKIYDRGFAHCLYTAGISDAFDASPPAPKMDPAKNR